MPENKPVAGNSLPDITVPKSGGGELTLFKPTAPHDWKLVIIYRGKHCPLCTSYLKELNGELAELNELGVVAEMGLSEFGVGVELSWG